MGAIYNDRPKIEDFLITETSETIKFIFPKPYSFEPKEDITAFELSQCLKHILGYSRLENETESVKRHFKEV